MVEVEEGIAVPVRHALDVKAVPVVEANRERPEADPPFERRIETADDPLDQRHALRKEIVVVRDVHALRVGPP